MDEVDRRIIAALQIDGRASWRQIGQLADVSESTAARRAQRLFDDGVVRVTGVVDPSRCGHGHPALVRLACEMGATRNVSRQLAERSDVRFVALVTGGHDIVMELIVRSRQDLAHFLNEELTTIEGIKQSTTAGVIRNFRMSYDWSRDALGGRESTHREADRPSWDDEPVPLDDIDNALIRLLGDDGRASFAALGFTLEITESTARRRTEALIRRGCLQIASLVAPQLVGYNVEVFAWLRVNLAHLETTAQALAARREVRYLSGTYGSSNLVLEAILRSNDDLYGFLTGCLGSISGIEDVDVAVELETVKRGYLRMEDARWCRPHVGLPLSAGDGVPGNGAWTGVSSSRALPKREKAGDGAVG
jgi:DNA-binding Lrp family transcriptional regulator